MQQVLFKVFFISFVLCTPLYASYLQEIPKLKSNLAIMKKSIHVCRKHYSSKIEALFCFKQNIKDTNPSKRKALEILAIRDYYLANPSLITVKSISSTFQLLSPNSMTEDRIERFCRDYIKEKPISYSYCVSSIVGEL